jgi:hypothetical protein
VDKASNAYEHDRFLRFAPVWPVNAAVHATWRLVM